MLGNVKAVIFDMDGTIVDSMWVWDEVDIKFLGKRGIPVHKDLHECINGMSFSETAKYFKKRFNLNDSIIDIKNEWTLLADDYYKNRISLKKGVDDLIKTFFKNNFKLGIGSSSSKHFIEIVLNRFLLKEYFHSIRVSCEVEKGKPYPDVYLKVAEDLLVNPKDCLVFEDSKAGVIAAKSAGMKVYAVADNYSRKDWDEIREIADGFFVSFNDVLSYLPL
ncbi:MAG TPA: HAD family phosphatase [Thermoanaerobacterales bacterium]|nr:HAD family phosphatase [Thermoanaerobacterales bacterium]